MTAALVAFMIVFVQMGANCAACHDLMSAAPGQSCQVQMSKMASSCCHLDHCATRCQLASQEKPFSVPKSTEKDLLNLGKVAPALGPVIMQSFSSISFLWCSAAKEPSQLAVAVYLLNTSFLI